MKTNTFDYQTPLGKISLDLSDEPRAFITLATPSDGDCHMLLKRVAGNTLYQDVCITINRRYEKGFIVDRPREYTLIKEAVDHVAQMEGI